MMAGYVHPDKSSPTRSECGLCHHMYQDLRPALPITSYVALCKLFNSLSLSFSIHNGVIIGSPDFTDFEGRLNENS